MKMIEGMDELDGEGKTDVEQERDKENKRRRIDELVDEELQAQGPQVDLTWRFIQDSDEEEEISKLLRKTKSRLPYIQ